MAKFCRKCGQPMPEDSLFCGNCGAKVEEASKGNAAVGTSAGGKAAAKNRRGGKKGRPEGVAVSEEEEQCSGVFDCVLRPFGDRSCELWDLHAENLRK